MRTRGLAGCVGALALLVLVLAAVSAGAQKRELDQAPHLFSVSADGRPAAALARTNARVIARYGAFTLVEASGGDAERLRRAGADLRDGMREVKLGRKEIDPARDRAGLTTSARGPELAVVQFVGPIKDAWLERLRGTSVRVVTYMAENSYLVRGTGEQLAAVRRLVATDPAFRALVGYTAADKLGAGLKQAGRQRLAVQTLSGDDGLPSRRRVGDIGRRLQGATSVGPFRTQFVEVDAAEAAALANDPGIVSIQSYPEPELYDERANQIVAGVLSGPDPLVPSGPGYLALNDGLGLGAATFPFTVDVTDEGLDAGSVDTDLADFHEGGVGTNPSRITYVGDFTPDANGKDCGGHGTINASIVAGFNDGAGSTVEDAQGFNYGLGVAPRVRVGGSKIFRCDGSFGLTSSVTALTNSAYALGARIANHSWGANTGGAYVANAQELDGLVRDAQPSTPGNQQMVEVVAAGNAGAAPNSIGSLGAAKNVLSVGASESPRASGTDACGVDNSESDDGHDMAFFSARGPTDDLRLKPDLIAPGTHITGSQSHAVGYDGSGVCAVGFPSGSTLYTLSSGTSHSSPIVAGMAALFREWSRQKRGGALPSPALTRAVLAGGGTDIAGGDGVNGSLPNFSQGWGLASIPRTLDTGPRFFWDQQTTFGATGEEFERVFAVQDPSKRVRVTLAWTDPPGPTFGNSFVNNLDLTVGAESGAYKGNVFAGGVSDTGGTADPRNNLESVYLPAGTDGNVSVSVTAANIAGNGVPGNPDPTDQDFALVVSNAAEVVAPVLAKEDTTVTPVGGDSDAVLEPGERFNVTSQIKNLGNAAATGVTGALDAASPLTITDASTVWPDLVPEQTAINANPLSGRIDPAAPCGAPATMSLAVTSAEGASSTIPIPIVTGLAGVAPHNSADVPKAIPDNNPAGVTSTVAVASPGLIQDVNVRVGSLTHTFVGDLRIELTSPSGTTVVLANRPGGNLNGGNDLTNTVFDDDASTAIGAGGTAAPYTGSFKPQADELSRFDGESQQGTWTLEVSDLGSADTGTLQAWRADISLRSCDFVPPPAPGQPTGLVATPGLGSVALEWDDTPGATSYEVFRRTGGGGYSAHPVAAPGSSSFTDAGRTAGEQYCYRVGALNDASPGPLSAEQCATALGPDNGGGGEVQISVDLSSLPRSVRVSRRRTLTLRFGATAGQAGVITLKTVKAFASARRRKLVVARRSFTSPASGRVRVKLKLTRRGFRVLKRKRRLAVTARVTLGEITAAKRVTLRAPRPRPRR